MAALIEVNNILYYSSSSTLTFNVTRMPSVQNHALFTALRQCCTVSSCKTTSGYMAVLFICTGLMPFLASTLDNADPLLAMVITQGLYLHLVEVAD